MCVCVQVHSTVCVCVCCYCLFALLSRYAQQRQRESGRERGEEVETDVLRQDLRASHLEIVISVKFKGYKTQRTLLILFLISSNVIVIVQTKRHYLWLNIDLYFSCANDR